MDATPHSSGKPSPSAPLINTDQADFMQRGVSIAVGACNASNMPSLARAAGCRVSSDLRQVAVFVSEPQAISLLDDLRSNGAIAVVFSEPSTHRTMQLKGVNASIGELADGDLEIVARHQNDFVKELASIGFNEAFVHSLLSCLPADLVCISFTPSAAFSQTPGPNAGEPLRVGA